MKVKMNTLQVKYVGYDAIPRCLKMLVVSAGYTEDRLEDQEFFNVNNLVTVKTPKDCSKSGKVQHSPTRIISLRGA